MKKLKGLLATVMLAVILMSVPQRSTFAMGISSQCGILVEQVTGRVLFEKCPDQQKYIASITKILTAIIAIENGQLNEWVEVSENATRQVGSSLYLALGDEMKLIDVIYGLMLRSGNDAAMIIAEAIGGDEAGFVKMMNEKAKELGMTNSIFQNPSGLDETTYNLSTARDMATLMRYAMNNPIFREITGTETHKATSKAGTPYVWHNKHKLITGYYEYAIGGKTGFTKQARRTLVTSAQKEDLELVVVTLEAGDDWNDHMSLFDYGFDQFELQKVIEPGELTLPDSKTNQTLYVKDTVYLTVKKDGSETVTTELVLHSKPIENEMGVLKVKLNDEIQREIPVYQVIQPKVEKQSLFDKLFHWFIGAVE